MRLGPRLYRRGLHGQPKIATRCVLSSQWENHPMPQIKWFGELPEELGQEALDNYFDMRQGKAESTRIFYSVKKFSLLL